jgi:hypothetical protein
MDTVQKHIYSNIGFGLWFVPYSSDLLVASIGSMELYNNNNNNNNWQVILLLYYNFTGFSSKLLLYWCYVFVLDLIHILWRQSVIGFNIVNKLKLTLKRYTESDTEYKEDKTITVITILNMRKNSEKVGTVLQKITVTVS